MNLQAAKVRWPGLFDGVDSTTEDWILDQMHIVNNLWMILLSFSCYYGIYISILIWFIYIGVFIL